MTHTPSIEIMRQIKHIEMRTIVYSLVWRVALMALSIVICMTTALAVHGMFRDEGRYELLEILSVDGELLRTYGLGEVWGIITDIPTDSLMVMMLGILAGGYVGYRLIRILPVWRRRYSSLRRI